VLYLCREKLWFAQQPEAEEASSHSLISRSALVESIQLIAHLPTTLQVVVDSIPIKTHVPIHDS
jgi:hypothetical protein